MYSYDDVDAKIIEILKNDARTPFTEIAAVLGVSDSTIHMRLKKLKKDGLILRYTIELNEELIGKKDLGFAMINVTPGHLEEVISKLLNIEYISNIYETHGVDDMIVLLKANNLDELRELIIAIRHIENVSSTTLMTILKIWK